MNAIFTHIKDLVGFSDPLDDQYANNDYDDYDDLSSLEYQSSRRGDPLPGSDSRYSQAFSSDRLPDYSDPARDRATIISMARASHNPSEVMVIEPQTFEEIPQAIQALREHKTVLLNLTRMELDHAQRAVDFISGGTYAIDGHQERIGERIFLFTPTTVHINSPKTAAASESQTVPPAAIAWD
ncbi:MAG TPA: cell division protein SepF [Chroococcidiopsis sp.]